MRTEFREGFLWGGATAATQYEGGYKEGGRGPATNDFVTEGSHTNPRRISCRFPDGKQVLLDREEAMPEEAVGCIMDGIYYPSHKATDFYHHFKEDIRLFAEMGFKCYRMSISWPRIFPKGGIEGEEANEEGLRFYEEVFQGCKKYGIEPLVTIFHFENPAYLADHYNGWYSRYTMECYLRYCEVIFQKYNGLVKYWIPINEINVLRGYARLGCRQTDATTRYQAMHHLFLANVLATKMCHELIPDAKIGCMLALSGLYPATCKPEDVMGALEFRRRALFFSDVMMRGYYPSYTESMLAKLGAVVKKEDGDDEVLQYIGSAGKCGLPESDLHYLLRNDRGDFPGMRPAWRDHCKWNYQSDRHNRAADKCRPGSGRTGADRDCYKVVLDDVHYDGRFWMYDRALTCNIYRKQERG